MILGHKTQIELLEKFFQKGRIFQPFLFWGPEKIGKKTVAIHFLEKIFQKSILNNPDIKIVTPEKNQISIEKIRELISFLSSTPLNSSFKGCLIDDCHLMTPEAQNCFLKTLEETSKNVIILISHLPENLLPTLVSRCQKIKFFQPPRNELEEFLKSKGLEQKKVEEILKFSFLKPAMIIEFFQDQEKLQNQKEKIEQIIKIMKSPLLFRFEKAKVLAQQSDLGETLKVWLVFFRALFLSEIKKENFNVNKIEKMKEVLSLLQTLEFLFSQGKINKKLALENLFLML